MLRSRADGERFVPTMSCALTRLLRNTCGGRCSRTAFFVSMSRALKDKRVTIHSLQVAHCIATIPRHVGAFKDDVGTSGVLDDSASTAVARTPSILERFALFREQGDVVQDEVPLLAAAPGSMPASGSATGAAPPTAPVSPAMWSRGLSGRLEITGYACRFPPDCKCFSLCAALCGRSVKAASATTSVGCVSCLWVLRGLCVTDVWLLLSSCAGWVVHRRRRLTLVTWRPPLLVGHRRFVRCLPSATSVLLCVSGSQTLKLNLHAFRGTTMP